MDWIFFRIVLLLRRKEQAADTVTGLRMFVRVCVSVCVTLHTVCVVFNVVSIHELTQQQSEAREDSDNGERHPTTSFRQSVCCDFS